MLVQKNNLNNKGFTFIETIIYIAIIGTVVASFVAFSMSISNSRNKTYVVSEVQANARIAMDLITQKIRMSSGVNIASSTFDTDPGVLSLSMTSSTLDPTIIDLTLDNGLLQIKEGANDAVSLVSNNIKITNLVFKNFTVSSTRENIGIEMTVEYNSNSDDVNFNYLQSLQTNVNLRR